MRILKFSPLQMNASQVRVEWISEPASPLYTETSFFLDFGEAMDPRSLPLSLWWSLVLLIVHCHWNLLRPCRIVLPVTLAPGEIEFWLRLLDQELVTLEKHRKTTDFDRNIEITCDGPSLERGNLPQPVDRWATAFSGGKDSLAQTALLCELTDRPLLVNTCAPMPPLIDNTWPYRDRTLSEIAIRRDVELVVVRSNLRTTWPHYEMPHELGYKVSLGQMGDPYLVLANTIAVAASRGIKHVTLATEIENALMEEYQGRVAFYDFNLACALPLLLAIDRLVGRFGMDVSSLLIPFNHFQIEYLIRKRYPDLADLQISCFWMESPDERSCSRCSKCFRVACLLLALGEDPASLDVDLTKLFMPPRGFDPIHAQMRGPTIAHALATMDRAVAKRFFPKEGLFEKLGLREPRAFVEFNRVADALAKDLRPHVESTHSEYFQFVPAGLRERIRNISLEYWPDLDSTENVPDQANIDSLTHWLTETL